MDEARGRGKGDNQPERGEGQSEQPPKKPLSPGAEDPSRSEGDTHTPVYSTVLSFGDITTTCSR